MKDEAPAQIIASRNRIWLDVPKTNKYIRTVWIPALQQNWESVLAHLDYFYKWSES